MILYYYNIVYVFQLLLLERRLLTAYFQKWDYKISFHLCTLYTSKNVCFTSSARFMFVSSIRRLTYHSVVQLSSFVICHVPVLSFNRPFCTQATPSVGFRREENTAGNCPICTLRLVRHDVSRKYLYIPAVASRLRKTGRRRPLSVRPTIYRHSSAAIITYII